MFEEAFQALNDGSYASGTTSVVSVSESDMLSVVPGQRSRNVTTLSSADGAHLQSPTRN